MRFKMATVQPEAYKALSALDKYISTSGIDKLQREMIKIRASQINGCAYCVNHHSKDARQLGETEQRGAVTEAGGVVVSDMVKIIAEIQLTNQP